MIEPAIANSNISASLLPRSLSPPFELGFVRSKVPLVVNFLLAYDYRYSGFEANTTVEKLIREIISLTLTVVEASFLDSSFRD